MAMKDQVETMGQPHVGNGHPNGHANGHVNGQGSPKGFHRAPPFPPPVARPRQLIMPQQGMTAMEAAQLQMQQMTFQAQAALQQSAQVLSIIPMAISPPLAFFD